MTTNCACNSAPSLIFACSGAADVGLLADQAARRLTEEGYGKMFCLAGVGGRVSGIIKSTEAADKIFAIDGCPLNCTKQCLEQAGFTTFNHLQLADIGFKKGKSPLSEEFVSEIVAKGKEMITGGCS